MSIENLTPVEQHRMIVEAINKLYPDYFSKRKGLVHSDAVENEITWTDVNRLAVFTSRIFNLTGGSVGNIDLYKLFQSYFLDNEKREQINEIL